MSTFQWYQQARARVEQFLTDLDQELEVEIEETSITPNDGSAPFETFVLAFFHASNPNLSWTMAVQPDEDFINDQLEEIVKRIYFERVE